MLNRCDFENEKLAFQVVRKSIKQTQLTTANQIPMSSGARERTSCLTVINFQIQVDSLRRSVSHL